MLLQCSQQKQGIRLALCRLSMADPISSLLQLVGALGASTGIAIIFIIYILFNLDKAESLVAKLTKLFSYFSMRAERHSIAASIQSKIRAYRKDNAVGDIMKHGIKFKWVTDEQNSSYIDGDDVIVIMSHHRNDAENFLNAVLQYAKTAVLPDVQNNIPDSVLSPIILVMQDKIISEQRPEAMPMFKKTIMHSEIKKDPSINHTIESLKQLDREGWFIQIYLNEIQHVGSRLYELTDKQRIETLNNFLQFLITIIERSPTQDVPLSFKNEIFGLNIILVGKWENVEMENIDVYTKRAEQAAIDEFDSIYVTGRRLNTDFTSRVIDAIKVKNIVTYMWTRKYGRKNRYSTAIVLALFRNLFVQEPDS